MHRRLAVPMLPLRVWVHCPRASNGLLPPRSYLVGYVRWYARSDSVLLFLLQTIIPTAFSSQMVVPTATSTPPDSDTSRCPIRGVSPRFSARSSSSYYIC